MEQVYKRKDFIVKLFACLFIAIFLVFIFIGSRVFASITSYTLKSSNEDSFILNIDIPNHILNINNVSVDSSVWDYDNIAFVNHDNNLFFIIVWNGNLIIKDNDSFFCDTNFRCLESTYFTENLSSEYSIARPFYNYTDTNNYRVSTKQLFNPNNYIFSTADIKDQDGNVVFQAPPQEQDKVLAPIVEGEEMKPLQEILQILPIVMIVIVGYLALRKGLAALFRFLRTS